MGPGDFFRQREVRCNAFMNNTYLRVFGTSLDEPIEQKSEADIDDKINVAEKQIRALDAIGVDL